MRYVAPSRALPRGSCAIVDPCLCEPASTPPLDNASVDSFRRDARVIGVIGFAHASSHFLQLALPPLCPLLRAEFGSSWTLLGLVAGTFYVASGVVQFAAGFVVDRVGARPVLLGGMGLLAFGTIAAAFAPNPAWLFPCVVLMGAGNGVFHPSDFAVFRRGSAQATSSALVSGGSAVGGTRQPSPTLRCASTRAASACGPTSSAIDWPSRGTKASR